MNWFWLNIPLATVFFLAWTLIPLWMVIRHPDTRPQAPTTDQGGQSRNRSARPGPSQHSAAPATQPEWGCPKVSGPRILVGSAPEGAGLTSQ